MWRYPTNVLMKDRPKPRITNTMIQKISKMRYSMNVPMKYRPMILAMFCTTKMMMFSMTILSTRRKIRIMSLR